jgi:uridine kinase
LLAGLDREAVALLLEHAEVVEIAAGERVAEEGGEPAALTFILDGEVHAGAGGAGLRTLAPGGYFGALDMMTGSPYAAGVTAASRLVTARLTPARWHALAQECPGVALALLQGLLLHAREELAELSTAHGPLFRGRSTPRARTVAARVGGEVRRVPTGRPLRELLPAEVGGRLVVAGLIEQKPVSLDTPLFADASVAPLTADSWEGRHIYVRSAGLLLLEAAHRVDPTLTVRMGPSRGPTQVVEVRGAGAGDLPALAARIGAEMDRMCALDTPFRLETWAIEEALAYFREQGWEDAAHLLAASREATAPLVSCGEVYALRMGPFLPSAGRIRGYRLSTEDTHLVIDYGRHDPRNVGGTPAPPRRESSDGDMAADHRAWLDGMGVDSVGAFNEVCVRGQVPQLIRVAEGFHEKRIGRIADLVAQNRDRLRIISIAGPSSSGKTTFIKRLTVQLQINGLNPVGISLDDYYVDREKTVRDENGQFDFEALEALDLALLQEHVGRLLAGETVRTARYDFVAGRSRPGGGPEISLSRGDILMLEGIHGLNPRLLGPIPVKGRIFLIFIHPVTTLPFDRLTRVSATDLRLMRRIVRDRHQRGYRAAENIQRWPSVQAGERRHIFPFQDEADVIFDSSLIYEPAVLKVYAERYLLEVPSDHPAYGTAHRLRHLVDRFVAIYPEHVPPTSILREFIGGSGFEY